MARDFRRATWDDATIDDCRQIVRLAIREDLDRQYDWTTAALVDPGRRAAADVVARSELVVAGLPAIVTAVDEFDADISLELLASDGRRVAAGTRLAVLRGDARDLLTAERTLLNLLGRMTGVATLTARFVTAVAGTKARIYDTRKTTPGWRRLEKYAVACGGGSSHRLGLYDAILIKDNHLAQFRSPGTTKAVCAAAAVRRARTFLADSPIVDPEQFVLEVEVDSLDQLRAVLPELPDVVLLDNMSCEQLREAVAIRDELAGAVELEASGGVRLETVRAIAETGVERISAGALTHSAAAADVALDWQE